MIMASRRNMTPSARGDSEWSFSCRTTPYNAYSDSDDSDAIVSDPGQDKRSDETKLLNDLDLSSREETVVYKPNPFSIAKINAASRGPVHLQTKAKGKDNTGNKLTSITASSRLEKAKTKTKSVGSNGSIIDGFKKQSQRIAVQPPERISNAVLKPSKLISRAPVDSIAVLASASLDNKPKAAPFHPLISPNMVPGAPVTLLNRSTPGSSMLNFLPPRKPIALTPFQTSSHPSPVAPAPVTLDPKQRRTHILCQDTPSRQEMLHIPDPIAISQNARPHTAYRAHALPFSSPPQHQTRDAEFSYSDRRHGLMPTAMSLPLKPSRRMGTLNFDVPIHPADSSWAGPVAPTGFPNKLMPSPRLTPAFAYRAREARMELTGCQPECSAPALFSDHDLGLARYDSPMMTSAPPMRTSRPVAAACMPPSHNKGYIPSSPTMTANMKTNYSATPPRNSNTQITEKKTPELQIHSEYLYPAHPKSTPNQCSPVEYKPEPSVSPSSSPFPALGIRFQTPSRPPNERKRDAYAVLTPDPDESWSTFNKHKKAKTTNLSGIQRTGKFRVPHLGLRASSSPKTKTGMAATSQRCVIVFLPPPLQPSSATAVAANEDTKTIPTPHLNPNDRHAYPSPIHSSSSPSPPEVEAAMSGTFPVLPPTRSSLGKECDSYSPLSPPPSDSLEPVAQGWADDVCMDVDLSTIGRLYPGMKAAWRERRRKSEGVWDLLGLPSCGRVYCDGGGEEREGEIEIVVFRGCG